MFGLIKMILLCMENGIMRLVFCFFNVTFFYLCIKLKSLCVCVCV